jgi:hypothetical protein
VEIATKITANQKKIFSFGQVYVEHSIKNLNFTDIPTGGIRLNTENQIDILPGSPQQFVWVGGGWLRVNLVIGFSSSQTNFRYVLSISLNTEVFQ